MPFKNIVKIIVPLSAAFMISCGDDAEEVFNNVTEFPQAQGESESTCSTLGIPGVAGVSKKDVLILVTNQTEFQTRYYSSSECAENEEMGRVTYQGEFAVDRTSPDEEDNAGEITFEMDEAKVELYSDTLVSAFNAVNYCGRSDYRKNEAVEVTSGSDRALCPVSDVPAVLYGQYEYNDNDSTIMLSADPVDMEFNQSVPSLPLIDVFASEFRKK